MIENLALAIAEEFAGLLPAMEYSTSDENRSPVPFIFHK
jgi:hypothetical protein